MNAIEEIDSTRPSGEAAAAAYAAAMARNLSGAQPRSESQGGGGQALPDAVVLVGGRASDRAAEMRKQAATRRLEAARSRTEGQQDVAVGEKMKSEGTQQLPTAQARVAEARHAQGNVQARAHDVDAVDAQAAAAEHEATQAQEQADNVQRQSVDIAAQAELLISLGQGEESEATRQQGLAMLRSSGNLEGEAKILYGKAAGKRTDVDASRRRASNMRTESSSALSSAQHAVSAAEEHLSGVNGTVARGADLIGSGNRQMSGATDMENHAALLEDRAELFSQANAIPFYVSPSA